MYRKILVPIDNSPQSNGAASMAVSLAEALGAAIVGFHVYAAQLHERRFVQMEPELPERYRSEKELQQQRSVHESLISQGLRLISESYLDPVQERCEQAGVSFERRLTEGRNYVEIIREARTGEYDLIALGAAGLGARRRSIIGSVCERVVRGIPGNVLVAKDGRQEAQGILVAIDGSPNSYQALESGLVLGSALAQPVEAVTVYDPQFHIVAFQRLAKVLSEETASLFHFKEQERLHTEIIDKGLERMYQSYLEKAVDQAGARGQEIETTILTGKAFQSILDHVEERHPWLLVAGRFGQHGTELADIGSTTENLVRLAPCNVLVVSGTLETPEASKPIAAAQPRLPWSPEAEARLQGVSAFAQPIVRETVERYAQRHDLAEITVEVMMQAREAMGW